MNQHIVPKFLLQNFTADKKHRVWVFDKHTGAKFRTNRKNVAAERGFYDLASGTSELSVEPALARVEDRCAPLIAEIVRRKSLVHLGDESRAALSLFFAVLMVRTKEHRLRFDHLGQSVKDHLRDRGASEEFLRGLDLEDEASKVFGLRSLVEHVPEMVPHFLSKDWALFEAPPGGSMYVSDNPVTLQNEFDHGPYGNLGLAVRGIEIHIPLSSAVTIGLLCPTVTEPFRRAGEQFRLLDRLSPGAADRALRNPKATREFCAGLETGNAIPLAPENLMRLNSLQVMFSSRFVYCEQDDFSLVERMLRENPKMKHGLKPTIG
jgi:hypothetical protein